MIAALHAAAAYLHARAGDTVQAIELYAAGVRIATNAAERDHLTREAARLRAPEQRRAGRLP